MNAINLNATGPSATNLNADDKLYFRIRVTGQGTTTYIKQFDSLDDAHRQLAELRARYTRVEHCMLGQGEPQHRFRTRRFHTAAQADSYMRGWAGLVRDPAPLDDFSLMGSLDRDAWDGERGDAS